MTARQIAALAVRVLALYALLLSFPSFGKFYNVVIFAWKLIPSDIEGDFHGGWGIYNFWSAVLSTAPALMTIAFAIVLWVFANPIAFWMVDENPTLEVAGRDALQLRKILFSTIGLIAILQVIPVLSQLVFAFESGRSKSLTNIFGTNHSHQYFAAGVQLIFGIFLLVSGRNAKRTAK